MFQMFPMGGEEFAAEMDRRQMEADSGRHEIFEALDSLSEEQTKAVDSIISGIIGGGKTTAGFWSGYMTYLMNKKFSICPACNKNHDEELRKQMAKDAEDDVAPGDRVPKPPDEGPTPFPGGYN